LLLFICSSDTIDIDSLFISVTSIFDMKGYLARAKRWVLIVSVTITSLYSVMYSTPKALAIILAINEILTFPGSSDHKLPFRVDPVAPSSQLNPM
jgi:hypothetical protein